MFYKSKIDRYFYTTLDRHRINLVYIKRDRFMYRSLLSNYPLLSKVCINNKDN